jgi:hypothetical protein
MTARDQKNSLRARNSLQAACEAVREARFDDAIELAGLAIESEPGATEVRIAAAHLFFVARQYERAFDELRQACHIRPGRKDQAGVLGAQLAHRLNRRAERTEFLALCRDIRTPALVEPGIAEAIAEGDQHVAVALAEQGGLGAGRDPTLFLRLAEAAAIRVVDDADGAGGAIQKLVARHVRAALSRSSSSATVAGAARALAAVGLPRPARSLLEQSLAREPNHAGVSQVLADLVAVADPLEVADRFQLALRESLDRTPTEGEIHGCTDADIASIMELLEQMARRSPPGPGTDGSVVSTSESRQPAPELPCPLGPDAIEHFIASGWVKLDRAFSPEVANDWKQRAANQIRTQPERVIRGYNPEGLAVDEFGKARTVKGEAAKPDLSDFDEHDPSTWRRSRIDYCGEANTSYVDFSVRLWGAVNQLIGVDRLETQDIGEYLILNLNSMADIPVESVSVWTNWHLDAPRSDLRIANAEAGLLIVLLFSDIGPRMGATIIAPDSVEIVSQAIASTESGVDFVARDATDRVMQASSTRKFLEGKTGDAYLLHPFMMHSASPNPSGIIRWMSNPILFLDAELRTSGPDLSPVEESIRRAIS